MTQTRISTRLAQSKHRLPYPRTHTLAQKAFVQTCEIHTCMLAVIHTYTITHSQTKPRHARDVIRCLAAAVDTRPTTGTRVVRGIREVCPETASGPLRAASAGVHCHESGLLSSHRRAHREEAEGTEG